ncbi:hypothetical protein [uncultured Microbulbifer sp.]|uniref:hypothetical protein n=1 Tax=uncultured Microbulbifer sp. TaxID=348147 RepID=UPI0025EADA3B|nr:hypothetical protein [uncultured Microbulbifer sp.]
MQDAELLETEAEQEASTASPKNASSSATPPVAPPKEAACTDAAPSPVAPPAAARSLIDRLAVGPQNLSQLSCGCLNPQQLQSWLLSNQQSPPSRDSAQRNAATLRSLLSEITRWRAPARMRLACLETVRPEVVALCAELTGLQQQSSGSAQTAEQRRAVLIASILCQHLAQAYTSVSAELTRAVDAFFSRRRLARGLHRAMDSYRRLIRISSQFYLATPQHSWVHLQLLMQLAREHKLGQRWVSDPLNRRPPLPGAGLELVAQPYLHTALFASTNPLQLSTGEQAELWLLCGRWARSARLLDRHPAGCRTLLASLRLDQAPIPAARLQHTPVDMQHFVAPRGWALDLSGPLKQLANKLQHPAGSNPDLLAHVHRLWNGDQGRGFQRTPADTRCDLAIGISTICHHMRQSKEPAPEISATFDSETASAGQHNGKHLVMEVGAVDFHSGRALSEYEVALPSAPSIRHERESRERQRQSRYQSVPATLTNTSSNGAGLRLPADTQGRLRCGDLVALTLQGRWEVAIVRWHYALPDQYRAGVEFLGGHSSAIRVLRHTSNGGRTDPMAGMLTGDSGRAPELVLPIPLFQCGDTVDIIASGQVRTVTLHQQTMTTGSFAIFEFS